VLPNKRRPFVSIMKYLETKGGGGQSLRWMRLRKACLEEDIKNDDGIFIICPKEY
jgi:hypothetical protein